MAASEYRLESLKVVYTARMKEELTKTIENLARTLAWTKVARLPVPQRLPRRQWRVTYLKSPYKFKHSVKHNVFRDWRYSFSFFDVENPHPVVTAVIGSMTPEVCCTCQFAWTFSGEASETDSGETHRQTAFSGGDKQTSGEADDERIRQLLEEERIVESISRRVETKSLDWFNRKYRWPPS